MTTPATDMCLTADCDKTPAWRSEPTETGNTPLAPAEAPAPRGRNPGADGVEREEQPQFNHPVEELREPFLGLSPGFSVAPPPGTDARLQRRVYDRR